MPGNVRVVFVSDGEYRVTISPPGVSKDLVGLEYQVGVSHDDFPSKSRNNSLLIRVDGYYRNVTRFARLCIFEICGEPLPLTFETNTAG